MAETRITDITRFLDEKGRIVTESTQEKNHVTYLAAIVLMSSFPAPEYPSEYIVKCRRRPNRKPCMEEIIAYVGPETDDNIIWMCPKCKDGGTISNWRGTLWDLSDFSTSVI